MTKFTRDGYIWRPPSLSELTPMIFNTGLTHLGSESSVCKLITFLFKQETETVVIFLSGDAVLDPSNKLSAVFHIDAILRCKFKNSYTKIINTPHLKKKKL